MRVLITILFAITHSILFCQNKHDYFWTFGSNKPIQDPNNFVLDFKNNKVSIYKYPLNIHYFRINANYSDNNGKLKAYTNGCFIMNSNGEIMENGNNLNPGFIHWFGYCPDSYPGGSQSHFFLPDPLQKDLIWLFHNSHAESEQYPLPFHLRVTKIDLHANGGLGKVIEKNAILVTDSLIAYGDLTTVKHSNNLDWWIISPTSRPDSLFRVFLLSKDGIHPPHLQHIGKAWSAGSGGGGFKANPNGTKLARYGYDEGVFLYDFDRSTGKLSNFVEIDTPQYVSLGGVEFSPSGKYLYVSTRSELFQYDMEASNMEKSIIRIDSLDGFKTLVQVTFGNLQLGPDCRIYVVPTTSVEYFGVIHYPDNPGKACDFRPHSLKLPYFNQLTRVYYPPYRMGEASICDSTIQYITDTDNPGFYMHTLSAFPNPAHDMVHFNLLGTLTRPARIEIMGIDGRVVLQKNIPVHIQTVSFDISLLPLGLYLACMKDDRGVIGMEKFVVE